MRHRHQRAQVCGWARAREGTGAKGGPGLVQPRPDDCPVAPLRQLTAPFHPRRSIAKVHDPNMETARYLEILEFYQHRLFAGLYVWIQLATRSAPTRDRLGCAPVCLLVPLLLRAHTQPVYPHGHLRVHNFPAWAQRTRARRATGPATTRPRQTRGPPARARVRHRAASTTARAQRHDSGWTWRRSHNMIRMICAGRRRGPGRTTGEYT